MAASLFGISKTVSASADCPAGGSITVNSNYPAGAYFITQPDGTTIGWNGTHTFTGKDPGFYSLRVDAVPGFTTSLSGPNTGTLTCGGSLSVTITYSPTTQICSTGTVVVQSNLQSAAYYLTLPNKSVEGWRGNHSFVNYPLGSYSLSVDDVPGYTKSVNGTTGTLTACGTLNAIITYTPTGSTATPTPTPTTATSNPALNKIVVYSNMDSIAYYLIPASGGRIGWRGSHTFTDMNVENYAIQPDPVAGYSVYVSQGSTPNLFNTGSTIYFNITYIPATPTPRPGTTTTATPTPARTSTPTPSPSSTGTSNGSSNWSTKPLQLYNYSPDSTSTPAPTTTNGSTWKTSPLQLYNLSSGSANAPKSAEQINSAVPSTNSNANVSIVIRVGTGRNIYLVTFSGSKGTRRLFPNTTTFLNMGYTLDEVQSIPNSEFRLYKVGPVLPKLTKPVSLTPKPGNLGATISNAISGILNRLKFK